MRASVIATRVAYRTLQSSAVLALAIDRRRAMVRRERRWAALGKR